MVGVVVVGDLHARVPRPGEHAGVLAGAVVVDRGRRAARLLERFGRRRVERRVRAADQVVLGAADLGEYGAHGLDVRRLAGM